MKGCENNMIINNDIMSSSTLVREQYNVCDVDVIMCEMYETQLSLISAIQKAEHEDSTNRLFMTESAAEVLREASVGEFFRKIIEAIKNFFKKIIDFIKRLFSKSESSSGDSSDSSDSSDTKKKRPDTKPKSSVEIEGYEYANEAYSVDKLYDAAIKTVKYTTGTIVDGIRDELGDGEDAMKALPNGRKELPNGRKELPMNESAALPSVEVVDSAKMKGITLTSFCDYSGISMSDLNKVAGDNETSVSTIVAKYLRGGANPGETKKITFTRSQYTSLKAKNDAADAAYQSAGTKFADVCKQSENAVLTSVNAIKSLVMNSHAPDEAKTWGMKLATELQKQAGVAVSSMTQTMKSCAGIHREVRGQLKKIRNALD